MQGTELAEQWSTVRNIDGRPHRVLRLLSGSLFLYKVIEKDFLLNGSIFWCRVPQRGLF